jgi:hypothetical protein
MQATGGDDEDKTKDKGYLGGALEAQKELFKEATKNMDAVDKTYAAIVQVTTELSQNLAGSERSTEVIGKNLVDAASGVLLLSKNAKSYEEAMLLAGNVIEEVQTATNRAYVATGKEIQGIIAAQEASGVKAKDLVKTFKEQGYSLQGIPKTIQKVIDTTRALGVNTAATTGKVVENLSKLNLYNFSNGVEGLTRMAAQAGMFGIEMGKIFQLADKLFDPEAAIDMAASLQRLGVATGDLLDPLKLMDLGQNNPQELQNQIVEMSKRFTYFNEQNQKFEILPGAKRELREIAGAVGMNADELAKLALGSSDVAKKMSEIRFPELKTGPLTEDQKTMIANLSEMKDGEYKIQVKETIVDEKGERAFTGRVVEKAVKELSPEDLKSLEMTQERGAKSLEEIAREQLNHAERQTRLLESISSQGKGAIATSRVANKGFEAINTSMKNFGDIMKMAINPEASREMVDQSVVAITEFAGDLTTMFKDGKLSDEEMKTLQKKALEKKDALENVFGDKDILKKLLEGGKETPNLILDMLKAATTSLTVKQEMGKGNIVKAEENLKSGAANIMERIDSYKQDKDKTQTTTSQLPTITNNQTNQTNQTTNNTNNSTTNNQTSNQTVQNNYQQNTFNQMQQMMSQFGSMDFSKMLDLNPLTSLQEKQLTANEGSYSELKNLNSILTSNNQTLISHLSKMTSINETTAQNKENKNITNEVLIDPSKLITQNNQNPTEIKNNIDQSVNNAVTNVTNDNRNQTTNNSNVKNNNEFVTNNTETSPIKFELPKVEFMPNSDLTSLITNQEKQFTLFEQRLESMNKGLMTNNSISDLTLSIRDLDKKINQDKTITPPIGSTVNNNITNNTQELTNVDKSNNSPVTNITNDNKNLATNNTNYNNDNKFITNNTEKYQFPKIEIPTFEVPKFDNLSSLLDNQYEKFDLMLDRFANKDNMFSDSNSKLITMLDNIVSTSQQNTPTQATTPTNTDFNIPPLQIAQPTNVQTPNITNITNTTNNNLTENMPQMATNTTSSMSYSGELKLTVDVTAPPGVDPNMVKDAIHKTLHDINVQESIMKNVTGGRVGQYNPTTGIPA